jgi:hypothetical protein
MLISFHQNASQIIKTANRLFENVAKFKYLRTKVKNQFYFLILHPVAHYTQ